MSDAPTQRLDATPGGEPEPGPDSTGRRNRTLLIVLIVVGAAVLIGIVVTVLLLLQGNRGPVALSTDSPAPTATTSGATPTTSTPPSPAATPTPTSGGGSGGGGTTQPTGGVFTAFHATTTVHCDAGTTNFTPPPIKLQVSWQTVRTDSVWFVQGTSDAATSQFMQVPVSGSQENFPYEVDYPCGAASATFNLTLVGSDGHHVQKFWTVTNTGDTF